MSDYVNLSERAFSMFSGTDEDRQKILDLHRAYLDANTQDLNVAMLRGIWSANPDCVWFNGTGYNYYGIEDWVKLWEYFRPRVKIVDPWTSRDVRVVGNHDMAVVTCERTAVGEWTGPKELTPEWTGKRWRSRSTEVFMRENGEWKCVHIHISTTAEGPRHDQRA